ncbi:hypothetical protein QUF80_23960 [Desulfococcaceae bacterium HSG8]|nr:hypothetical protein [Desulfococcaceae bacterium HSG8]
MRIYSVPGILGLKSQGSRGIAKSPPVCGVRICQSEPSEKGPCWPEMALLTGAPRCSRGIDKSPHVRGAGVRICQSEPSGERAMLAGKGPADRGREPEQRIPPLLAGDWQIPACAGFGFVNPNGKGPCWPEKSLLTGAEKPLVAPSLLAGIDKSPHVRGSDLSIRTERKGAMLAGNGPADRGREAPRCSLVARGGLTNLRMCGVRICQSEPSGKGLLAGKDPAGQKGPVARGGLANPPPVRGSDLSIRTERKGPGRKGPCGGRKAPVARGGLGKSPAYAGLRICQSEPSRKGPAGWGREAPLPLCCSRGIDKSPHTRGFGFVNPTLMLRCGRQIMAVYKILS